MRVRGEVVVPLARGEKEGKAGLILPQSAVWLGRESE